jgi:hypothetical protein
MPGDGSGLVDVRAPPLLVERSVERVFSTSDVLRRRDGESRKTCRWSRPCEEASGRWGRDMVVQGMPPRGLLHKRPCGGGAQPKEYNLAAPIWLQPRGEVCGVRGVLRVCRGRGRGFRVSASGGSMRHERASRRKNDSSEEDKRMTGWRESRLGRVARTTAQGLGLDEARCCPLSGKPPANGGYFGIVPPSTSRTRADGAWSSLRRQYRCAPTVVGQ